jgi:hypothetical protein
VSCGAFSKAVFVQRRRSHYALNFLEGRVREDDGAGRLWLFGFVMDAAWSSRVLTFGASPFIQHGRNYCPRR